MVDASRVEDRVEQIKASTIEVGVTIGNLLIGTPKDLEDMAKRLERASVTLPVHLRGKGADIYFLSLKALEWRMPIASVLENTYVSYGRGGVERIGYTSMLIHAVIERNAPIKGRLRYKIEGEGDERRCVVWATFRGEDEPHEYKSETLGKLRDARGRNPEGLLKGSPLWDHQPEVQLFYSSSRQWARIYCPDVILGAYTPEDPQYATIDVTPDEPPIVRRLREANQKAFGDKGFDVAHVTREAGRRTVIDGNTDPGAAEQEADNEGRSDDGRVSDPVTEERRGGTGGGSASADITQGSDTVGDHDPAVGAASAGHAGVTQEPTVGTDAGTREGSAGKPKGRRK